MSLVLFAVAAVAAVNAPRASAALSDEEPALIGGLAAALTLAPLVALAAVADPLSDALELTRPTLRMAAGTLLVVQGVVTMFTRPPAAEPRLPGRRAALVPLAFPVLLTPGLGLLAVSGSLDHSAPVTMSVLALALTTVVALSAVGPGRGGPAGERVLRATAVVLAAVLVVVGLGLVADGVFDV